MRNRIQLLAMAYVLAACWSCGPQSDQQYRLLSEGADWPAYGGGTSGNRYSPLNQIDTSNVGALEVAWQFDTGENTPEGGKGHEIQCQPIVVDGVVYAT